MPRMVLQPFLALVGMLSTVAETSAAFSLSFDYVAPLYAPYALVQMGTPPQQVACVLDIGSSDTLAIDTAGYNGPGYIDRYCPASGSRQDSKLGEIAHATWYGMLSYDSSITSSLEYNTTGDSFNWNQYQTVQGVWATEAFGIDDVNWTTSACFGLINSNNNTTSCVVGLGPVNGEIAGQVFEDHTVTPSYPNMLQKLLEDKQITSPCYSIWFNRSEERGAVVFGGTDVTKFVGTLTAVPIVSYVSSGNQVSHIPGTLLSVRIMFHGMSVYYRSNETSSIFYEVSSALNIDPATTEVLLNKKEINSYAKATQRPHPAVINASRPSWKPALKMTTSITTDISTMELFSRLPRELVSKAADMLGLRFISPLNMYGGSCHARGLIRFNLSSYNCDMAVRDLMVPAESLNVTDWKTSTGEPLCLFTIIPEDSYSYVLGNGFLRNTYTFVDMVQDIVAFAPLNFSAPVEISDIKEFNDTDLQENLNTAWGYGETSLMRSVQATYLANGTVANGDVNVISNGALAGMVSSLVFYLFAFLL